MEWMILPLKRYADFQGRSRRKEYWMFTLGFAIVLLLGVILFAALGNAKGGSTDGIVSTIGTTGAVILGIAYLAIIVPSIAVQVRRFHDQDKSGWFVLLAFIPYIGGLIMLIFMCREGTKGPNRFGPDPKDPNGDLETVFS